MLLLRRKSKCVNGGGLLPHHLPHSKEGAASTVTCTRTSAQWAGGEDYHRSWQDISTSWKIWPGWSGTTADKRRYYIIKANRLPRSEEEINVDLPAYFMHINKEDDPRPRWLFVKEPTSKAYHKKLYEKLERFYRLARPREDAVYWLDLLDRSSKGIDPTAPAIHKVTPDAPWCCDLPALFRAVGMTRAELIYIVHYQITRIKALFFLRSSKFWNLQTLNFMHMVRSGEVVCAWIMRGHRFKPRSG